MFLYLSAWQTLEKTFPLREQIKASLKQVSYCSTAWVPASKKQIDEYLAVSVTEDCKFSGNYFCRCFFPPGDVSFTAVKPKVGLARLKLLALQGAYRAGHRGRDDYISQGWERLGKIHRQSNTSNLLSFSSSHRGTHAQQHQIGSTKCREPVV